MTLRRSRRGEEPEYGLYEKPKRRRQRQNIQSEQQPHQEPEQQSKKQPEKQPEQERNREHLRREQVQSYREPSTMSNLSGFSVTLAEDWETLKRNAMDRVRRYILGDRSRDKLLVPGLLASLEFLPELGAINLTRDILSMDNDARLHDYFDYIYQSLFIPMRTNLKKSIIPQSPIPLHQEQAEKVTSYLSSPARREQEIYENALKRDGRRCIITRYLLASDFRNTGAEVPPGEGTVAKLEVAHIIPFLYGSYKNQELSFIYDEFGDFRIALRPTGNQDEYEVKLYPLFTDLFLPALPQNRILQLRASPGYEHIKLPDPDFLDVHYRLAEIFHASGIGYEIDRYIQDFEDLACFAEDGSTNVNQLLTVRLAATVSS
ncbi:hypothetical protein DTO207G8_940 [Paecilomyces variotii]|nr:hypothetical protein DTO207G8_940 [Paecilomyces variotii]KAJ9409047.1 hypothetical protein DTO045G8_3222 [Paecilomyces variotii]